MPSDRDCQTAFDFGAHEFVDLENDTLEDVGGVDLVFDVFGGDIGKRSARLVRAGGTLVTVTGPPEAWPADGLAVDFVVVSDRAQLGEIVRRVRDGRLRSNIGKVATLEFRLVDPNGNLVRVGEQTARPARPLPQLPPPRPPRRAPRCPLPGRGCLRRSRATAANAVAGTRDPCRSA